MAKKVVEYSCLVISPSDVEFERVAVSEVLQLWNGQIGSALDARIEAVRWETHATPDASEPAQQVLNRQIVDGCDFGVAIFWTRIGSPTETGLSGSIEEIERLRKRGARVLVYFNTAAIPQDQLRDDQFDRLMEFKARLDKEGLRGSYSGVPNLREQVLLHSTAVVVDLLAKERGQPSPDSGTPSVAVLTAPPPDVRVIIFPAQTIPPTRGVNHILGIRVQNHSPVVVFVSGIAILLKSGKALLVPWDTVSGVRQTRTALRPGESLLWSANGDALLRDWPVDDLDAVIVHDDIGRTFQSPPGALQKIASNWQVADSEQKKPQTA